MLWIGFVFHPAHLLHDVAGFYQFGLGDSRLNVRQARGRALFDTDGAAALPAGVNALEYPLHPVHWAGIIEVDLDILDPPELYLVGFEAGHEQRWLALRRDQHRQRALGGQVKISGGVHHVVRVQQHQSIEIALSHFGLHLLDLALVPLGRQTVRPGRGGKIRGHFQHSRVAEGAGRCGDAERCGSSCGLHESTTRWGHEVS